MNKKNNVTRKGGQKVVGIKIHSSTKASIVNALKNIVDARYRSTSLIAKRFGVSKATVIEINKEIKARSITKEEGTRLLRNEEMKIKNRKRYLVILEYVKKDGIKKSKDLPVGVSVNHLLEYLKARNISPGDKRNLTELLKFAIKEVSESTGMPVVRRTKSDQPKRK